jgi:hypothetical protein
MQPPPPDLVVLRAPVRMHTSLTSCFATGASRYPQVSRGFFSGPSQVLHRQHMQGGTTSRGPHAAPLRVKVQDGAEVRWVALGMTYALALLKRRGRTVEVLASPTRWGWAAPPIVRVSAPGVPELPVTGRSYDRSSCRITPGLGC